jgi:hypothetical protein
MATVSYGSFIAHPRMVAARRRAIAFSALRASRSARNSSRLGARDMPSVKANYSSHGGRRFAGDVRETFLTRAMAEVDCPFILIRISMT